MCLRKMELAMVAACACMLAGCQAGAPVTGAALGVVQVDDWTYDDQGAVLIMQPEPKAMTDEQGAGLSKACKSLAIVGVDLLPDGRIGAVMLDGNAFGLAPGQWFDCNSLEFDPSSAKIVADMDDQNLSCCQMKVEQLDGVTRITCSGTCDGGGSCSVQVGETGTIVFTCGCPAGE